MNPEQRQVLNQGDSTDNTDTKIQQLFTQISQLSDKLDKFGHLVIMAFEETEHSLTETGKKSTGQIRGDLTKEIDLLKKQLGEIIDE